MRTVKSIVFHAVIFLIGWLLTSSTSLVAGVESPEGERIIYLDAEYLFVPNGFDDNDQVEVVVDGWLQDSCHQPIVPEVKFDSESGVFLIMPRARVQEGVACAQVLHRFTSVAELGVLPSGYYEVYTNDALPTKVLEVYESSSAGPDEQSYAQIDHVYVDFVPDRKGDSRWEVVLEGRFVNSCQEVDRIEIHDAGETLMVLPILANEGFGPCLPREEAFVRSALLPDYDDKGRYLLHVRSADGESVNEVFSTYNYFGN